MNALTLSNIVKDSQDSYFGPRLAKEDIHASMKDRLARKNKALADDIELEHVVGDPFFYTILVAKAPGELYNTAAWAEFGKRWADYNKGLTLEEKQSFEVVLMPSKTRLYEIKSLLYAEHLDKAEKAAAAAEGMEVEPTYEGEPAQEIKSEEEELAAKMGDLNLSLDKLKAENFAEWHRIEVTALWQWAVEIHERLGNMGSLGCFPTIKANLDKEQVEKFEAGGYDTRFVFVLLQNKLKTVVALIKDHFGKGPRFLSAGFHVIAVRKSDGAVSMRLVHVKNSWRNSDSWGGNAVATQLAAFDSVEQWYGQAGEQLAEETIYAEGLQEVVQKYAGAGAEDKNGTKYVNGIPITTKFNSDFALKKAEWFQGDAQDPARNIDNLIDICGTFILFGDDECFPLERANEGHPEGYSVLLHGLSDFHSEGKDHKVELAMFENLTATVAGDKLAKLKKKIACRPREL